MMVYVVMHSNDYSEFELPRMVFRQEKDAKKYMDSLPSHDDGVLQYYTTYVVEFVE